MGPRPAHRIQIKIKLTDKPPTPNSPCFPPGRAANLRISSSVAKLLSKEFRYGHDRLERAPYLWVDFHSHAYVRRRAWRAHQLQPAPQCVPFAPQTAPVLPGLQPQRGALRNREGSRV